MKILKTLKMVLEPENEFSEVEVQDPSYYFNGKLAVDLSEFMGCAYHFVAPKRFANGPSESLEGAMLRSGADIILRLHNAKSLVLKDFTFSYPVEINDATFVAKRLIPSPNSSAILQPFSPFVWVSLAVSILAMTFAILYVFKKRNLSDSVFSVLATASGQAPFLQPKTTPERILMGSWLLGMTVVTAAYLSLLLSYLTFPNLREPRTILELANAVEKGDYQCYSTGKNALDGLINSSIEANRIIGKNKIEFPFEEFERSPATKVAYLERREFCTLMETIFPTLVVSEDSFFSAFAAFKIRKDFPFKDKLNRALRRMIETGIYAKATYFPYYRYRTPYSEPLSTRKLTLLDFKVVFIILVVGHGVSILILLLERVSYKQKRLKRRKRRIY